MAASNTRNRSLSQHNKLKADFDRIAEIVDYDAGFGDFYELLDKSLKNRNRDMIYKVFRRWKGWRFSPTFGCFQSNAFAVYPSPIDDWKILADLTSTLTFAPSRSFTACTSEEQAADESQLVVFVDKGERVPQATKKNREFYSKLLQMQAMEKAQQLLREHESKRGRDSRSPWIRLPLSVTVAWRDKGEDFDSHVDGGDNGTVLFCLCQNPKEGACLHVQTHADQEPEDFEPVYYKPGQTVVLSANVAHRVNASVYGPRVLLAYLF